MNVLLTHAYSRENKGDAAILSVLIKEVKKNLQPRTIIITTMENTKKYQKFEGQPQIASLFYLSIYRTTNIFGRLFFTSYIFSITFIWAVLYRWIRIDISFVLDKKLKGTIQAYRDADLIIPIGGGYLRGNSSINGTFALIIVLYEIFLGELLGKKITLYSQSIGPFATSLQTWFVSFVLRKVDLIIVRENFSLALLHKLNIPKEKIAKFPDAAFLLDAKKITKDNKTLRTLGIKNNRKIVGITARQWMSKKEQTSYEKHIATFADFAIREKHMQVLFIPQVTSVMHNDDDSKVEKRIMKYMKEKEYVWCLGKNYTHQEIKNIYGMLHYLIGTRMHSNIFALLGNVPVIAIAYEYKTQGIMQDLGLMEWVLPIEKVTAEGLINAFSKLIKKSREYLALLDQTLPSYREEANKAILAVKSVYLT